MHNIRIKQLPKTGDQRGYSLVDRNDLYIKTNPINQDTNVKNTISAVPREEANIEAEGGETVVGDINGDGMLEHSNIVGKKHTKGGVPLNINPGSFIFSDTDKLKIKDLEVQALFGMAPNKKGYTPAAIAKKYPVNNFMNTLKIDEADELSKRTAEMMLKNNLEKLGQLALVQESMKGFPDGIPAIAESVMAGMQQQGPQGNNPQEESQEQPMARYGGSMPSYQNAGTVKKKVAKEKPYIPTNKYKVGTDKSTGYWDRVANGNVFQRVTDDSMQNDPRMDIAAQKLNPFSDKVEGFGDYFGNLLSIPQKEINNLLTGYYESPMDTKARYSEVSDNQHFWGDVALDPMMYPELPYAAAKGTVKVVGKGIQKAAPYAKKVAQLTTKYGKQAAEFLSQYIGKIPFEQLLSKGYLVANRAGQAGMHAMDSPEDKGYERLKSAKINGEDGQIGLIGNKWFDTYTGKEITEFSKFVPKTASQNKIINPTPNDYIQEATETLPYAPIYNTPPAPVVVKTNDVVKRNKTLPQKSTIKTTAPKVAQPIQPEIVYDREFEYGGSLATYQTAGTVKTEVKRVVNGATGNIEITYSDGSTKIEQAPLSYDVADEELRKNVTTNGYGFNELDPQFRYKRKQVGPQTSKSGWLVDPYSGFLYNPKAGAPQPGEAGMANYMKIHKEAIDNYEGGAEKWKQDMIAAKGRSNPAMTHLLTYENKAIGKNANGKEFVDLTKQGAYVPGVENFNLPGIYKNPVVAEKPKDQIPAQQNTVTTVEEQPKIKNTPWWIQDDLNLAGAMTDSVRKYGPAMTSIDASIPGYVVEDPTRQLANIQQNANAYGDMMQNSTAGNVAGASMLNATGQSLNAGADVIGQVQNRNVQTVNQAMNTGTQIANNNQVANANAKRQYMVDSATTNQQYDNALREKKWREIQAFNNGTTNMMRHKQMEDVLFPQYSVNSYNGDVTFNDGMEPVDQYGNKTYNPRLNRGRNNASYEDRLDYYQSTKGFSRKEAMDAANDEINGRAATASSGRRNQQDPYEGYDNTPKPFNQPAKNGGRIYQFGGKVYYGALQELNF